MVRQKLTLVLYLFLVEYLVVFLIWSPADALIQSSTGWAQIASASAISSYTAANRAALISQLAASAAEAGAATMAARVVAGSAFGIVGVLAGLALYQIYYNQQQLTDLRNHAAPPGSWSVAGFSYPITDAGQCPNAGAPCSANGIPNGTWYIHVPNEPPYQTFTSCMVYSGNPAYLALWNGSQFIAGAHAPPGYTNWYGLSGTSGCYAFANAGGATPQYAQAPATQTDIQNYLTGLPPSSPDSIESHIQPLGQGATAANADAQTITSVSPSQLAPTTVASGNVTSGDAVLNPNASPPSNTSITNNTTQTTTNTTNTTTTTNQDGSTTTTQSQQETASASCTTGTHDQRTMGSVLQDHLNKWNSSGLVSALNVLKMLVWPSNFPTYTLNSSLFGTLTFDFSGYAWAFTALRSVIIAVASFVAYRIVFVGNA
jgi:hypothetical protein